MVWPQAWGHQAVMQPHYRQLWLLHLQSSTFLRAPPLFLSVCLLLPVTTDACTVTDHRCLTVVEAHPVTQSISRPGLPGSGTGTVGRSWPRVQSGQYAQNSVHVPASIYTHAHTPGCMYTGLALMWAGSRQANWWYGRQKMSPTELTGFHHLRLYWVLSGVTNLCQRHLNRCTRSKLSYWCHTNEAIKFIDQWIIQNRKQASFPFDLHVSVVIFSINVF